MVKPIPDEVKEILSGLPTMQQVIMKGYIASLRSEIKDMETEMITKNDPDPNAHYHGHEKCTVDHEHKDHDHKEHDHSTTACTENHDHGSHDHKGHDHDDNRGHDHGNKGHDHDDNCGHDHGHKGHDHGHKGHDHDDNQGHKRHDGHDHDKCGHDHGHKEHDHDHNMPDWKKQALESSDDAGAAPFGGSWNKETEMNIK
jgi:hypothetical protein